MHSFHGSTDATGWSGINTSDIIDNDMSLSMSMLNMSLEESQVCAVVVVCLFTQVIAAEAQENKYTPRSTPSCSMPITGSYCVRF